MTKKVAIMSKYDFFFFQEKYDIVGKGTFIVYATLKVCASQSHV